MPGRKAAVSGGSLFWPQGMASHTDTDSGVADDVGQ